MNKISYSDNIVCTSQILLECTGIIISNSMALCQGFVGLHRCNKSIKTCGTRCMIMVRFCGTLKNKILWNHSSLYGPMFVGKQIFAGSLGRYFVDKLYDV